MLCAICPEKKDRCNRLLGRWGIVGWQLGRVNVRGQGQQQGYVSYVWRIRIAAVGGILGGCRCMDVVGLGRLEGQEEERYEDQGWCYIRLLGRWGGVRIQDDQGHCNILLYEVREVQGQEQCCRVMYKIMYVWQFLISESLYSFTGRGLKLLACQE